MTAQIEVTIANGASQSSEVDLRNLLLCGIVMPADWTAANLTFKGAAGTQDGVTAGTYQDVYDADGTELNVTAAASRHIVVSPSAFAGIQFPSITWTTSPTGPRNAFVRRATQAKWSSGGLVTVNYADVLYNDADGASIPFSNVNGLLYGTTDWIDENIYPDYIILGMQD